MPSAAEMPNIELDQTVTPSPTNPLGVKGIGEAGTIASTPAVMNAVVDALSPFGITDIVMPATPGSRVGRHPRVTIRVHSRRCAVIPAAFEFVRADSAEHAVSLIGEHGDDAKFLAGGMSLIPLMKLRLATPTVLIDVGRVTDLSYVRDGGDHVAIGALTRHRDLETSDLLVAASAACCARSRPKSATTRSGTAARSAVRRHTVTRPRTCPRCCSRSTRRSWCAVRTANARSPASDFFLGFLETALAPDELLCEIRVPKTGANGFNYQKFNRRAQDWAIVGAVATRVNGGTNVALGEHGFHAVARHGGRTGARAGCVRGGRGRARGRRHRTDAGPERVARVPRAPRARARSARAGSRLIAVVVLAAGRGERFGGSEPKQLAGFAGRPLITHALDAARASKVGPIMVVVADDRVAAAIPAGFEILRNPTPESGIASSLQVALRALEPRGDVDAVVVGLADQPLVGAAAYRRVASAYDDGARLAVATYRGARGNPVLIARPHWSEALDLEGDEGARVLLRRYGATEVPCDDTGDPSDVDTTADLAALEANAWRSTTASE